jgi:hypothetical protein
VYVCTGGWMDGWMDNLPLWLQPLKYLSIIRFTYHAILINGTCLCTYYLRMDVRMCVYLCMYLCMRVCMYVCIYVCMYACAGVYTLINPAHTPHSTN